MKNFSDWKSEKSNQSDIFFYWESVIELEVILCQFIKSLRKGNFKLYISSLELMIPWVFALNHGHYSRWLPVHIRDMLSLENEHPQIFMEFMEGNFVVQKSSHKFSMIGMDQNHEQLNKDIKGDGGVKGLFGNKDALEKWMVAGPEIQKIVHQFEHEQNMTQDSKCSSHHEQGHFHQEKFVRDVQSLLDSFEDLGNPFKDEHKELINIKTKEIANDQVVQSIRSAKVSGEKAFKNFWDERIEGNKPLSDPIPRSKLVLFKNSQVVKSKGKAQVSSLKKDCNLLSRLFISSAVRDPDLNEFFAHENQAAPPALSYEGQIRKGSKSDLINCLEKELSNQSQFKSVTALILDGAVIIHLLEPKTSDTYKDYFEKQFYPYIKQKLNYVERLDIVWDTYTEESLKEKAREQRGASERWKVTEKTKIQKGKNWTKFLRNPENKTELFRFLSKNLADQDTGDKIIYSTFGTDVLVSKKSEVFDLSLPAPCNHEEADTR